jgi:hypothetical protein
MRPTVPKGCHSADLAAVDRGPRSPDEAPGASTRDRAIARKHADQREFGPNIRLRRWEAQSPVLSSDEGTDAGDVAAPVPVVMARLAAARRWRGLWVVAKVALGGERGDASSAFDPTALQVA